MQMWLLSTDRWQVDTTESKCQKTADSGAYFNQSNSDQLLSQQNINKANKQSLTFKLQMNISKINLIIKIKSFYF